MAVKLSPTQRAALEAAAKGSLMRQRRGWANSSAFHGFPTATIEALARHGLMTIKPLAGCCGAAHITKGGREALS